MSLPIALPCCYCFEERDWQPFVFRWWEAKKNQTSVLVKVLESQRLIPGWWNKSKSKGGYKGKKKSHSCQGKLTVTLLPAVLNVTTWALNLLLIGPLQLERCGIRDKLQPKLWGCWALSTLTQGARSQPLLWARHLSGHQGAKLSKVLAL